MSYLTQSMRLHFAGQFQATVSTVNNDVTHFNNEKFKPNFQERGSDNGWWNPAGDGVWRLLGCDITSAFLEDGSKAPDDDPVFTLSIADSDDSAPAKIVDLDPQQQMVSTIFGLKVRIANANGDTIMKGDFAPSAFTELWNRVWSTASGDAAFGAMWQSVVTVRKWGDVSDSRFLTALKAAADANDNLLSIKFNVDLYSMQAPVAGEAGNDNFCRGRVVGTLGPASNDEPRRFVTGRQLCPTLAGGGAIVNFCSGIVDERQGVIRLDLGNALPVEGSGSIYPLGDLSLQVTIDQRTTTLAQLAESVYTNPEWYPKTAGIVEFPISSTSLKAVKSNPLQIALENSSAPALATEMPDGLHVRADLFVFRLSPEETQEANFFASKFGQPYGNAKIVFFNNPAGLQGQLASKDTIPGSLTPSGSPYINAPADGIVYLGSITTDSSGRASTHLTGGDTKNFRAYIDGQIYGIGYGLTDQGYLEGKGPRQNLNNIDGLLANPWNFLSVLVFDRFTPETPLTWWGSMEPIFKQYANLYPVMARFVDLGDFEQVKPYAKMLIHAFSLSDDDPNAMPVTRDLSPAKRAAILTWLNNPLEGTPPKATSKPTDATSMTREAAGDASNQLFLGGKAAAMARRVCKQ